ncbi:MAG: RtcB family protein [bacterium]
MIEEIFDPHNQTVPVKSWATGLETSSREQFIHLASLPFIFKHVAAMPDAHTGIGAAVGSVFATQNEILPAAVGVDIGCGMCALPTRVQASRISLKDFDRIARKIFGAIPTGFKGHKAIRDWPSAPRGGGFDYESSDPELTREIREKAAYKIGTLGGGNHFIELQRDPHGNLWLMVHSGSRNIGKQIADHFIKTAKRLNKEERFDIPPGLNFLRVDSEEGKNYLADMNWALAYAFENRRQIVATCIEVLADELDRIKLKLDYDPNEQINIHHNYAVRERHFGRDVWVHRKGATAAHSGLRGIIPGSMGTASYIVVGKGNPESFCSCSHGAGRAMSRTEARLRIGKHDLERALGDVKVAHGGDVRDEAPQAYKNITQVMDNQSDLVDILVKLTPLATVKG